jgi:hypothetical protein
MVTILTSSHTAPFNSVIICCTTVTTTLNILSRGSLFTLGARTDWPVVCCSCWGKSAGTLGSIVAGPATCCCSSVLPRTCLCGEVGREHPSRCSPGSPLRLLFLHLLLRVSAAPMGVFSFRQPTVAARCPLSRGTPCDGDRHRKTNSGKVACSLPRCGRTAGSYGTA